MRAGLGLQQQQQLRQQLVMTPKLQQAIRVMQMNSLELQQHISQELQQNPFLEEGPDLELEEEQEASLQELNNEEEEQLPAEEEREPEIRPEDFLDDSLPPFPDPAEFSDEEEEDESRRMEMAESVSFHDYLNQQLTLLRLTEEDRKVAELILGNLDDDGFLAASVEEIAQEAQRDPEEVEEILRYLQTHLDPIGVGARNRQEFFLIQAEAAEDPDPIAVEILRNHYDSLLRNQIPKIAKALQEQGFPEATPARVQQAKEWLGTLRLSPAQGFFEGIHGTTKYESVARPIVPDVIVEKVDGEWVVRAVEDSVPRIHLNRKYLELLRHPERLRPEERKWLEEYRQRAQDLIESLYERSKTIENVAREIFEVQRDFLEHGVKHLKPLVLRDIAERLGKHESTISRATSGKYAQTPRGVYELKFFFSSGLTNASGERTSSKSVRAQIEEIIQNEDPAHPLSDKKISEILAERGIKVARRTVTKYREELGIPPSNQRKSRW